MIKYIAFTFCLMFAFVPLAQAGEPLEAFTWKNRIILIFAAEPEDDAFKTQSKADSQNFLGLVNRDIELFTITGAAREVSPYVRPNALRAKDLIPDGDALHTSYNPYNLPFLVVLVGKDGGIKGEWHNPVPFAEIFTLIDAMPMRIREMSEDE